MGAMPTAYLRQSLQFEERLLTPLHLRIPRVNGSCVHLDSDRPFERVRELIGRRKIDLAGLKDRNETLHSEIFPEAFLPFYFSTIDFAHVVASPVFIAALNMVCAGKNLRALANIAVCCVK